MAGILLFLMSVSPLLTVFGFLPCRAAAVCPSDILLRLGLGLHLAIVLRLVTSTSEVDAVFQYMLPVVHLYRFTFLPFNGGTGVRQ